MASFNHQIDKATPFNTANLYHESSRPYCHVRKKGRRCQEPVAFVVSYDYVTGQAGRVARVRKCRCEKHGVEYADKYKLWIDEK